MTRNHYPTETKDPGPHTKEADWRYGRRFDPREIYGDDIDLDIVECRSDSGRWVYVACDASEICPQCGNLPGHIGCIIGTIASTCRRNGTDDTQAAVGVYFGKENPYNRCFQINVEQPTNQIAELMAGIDALQQALVIQRRGFQANRKGQRDLRMVVIKSDSEYLVKGMTEWILKWKENGYRNAKGAEVVNAKLFERLEVLYSELVNRGVWTLFWKVERERNRQADRLANRAFEAKVRR
ncbi:ribonuclease [Talaromyces pinophilus]|jgi:ribonuclease HI|uniref:ribonuclease H n=1 Tax=Talaromyces pinophilus TaxID=128442 RepID=A0A6V8HHV4_TALPI|nr:Ribonuclease H1 [Talaromyces pinophilus]GAM37814.1 ribonuclease [Talaromyces pinophilus]